MQIWAVLDFYGPLSIYETNQPTHGHIVPTKYVILPTRYYWLIEKNFMFPTQNYTNFGSLAPLARNNLWVFQVSGFLVAITRHEREYITSVTNARTFTNKILRRIVYFRRKNIFRSLAIMYSFFLSFCCYCTDQNMLFTNKTMRRIACFRRNAKVQIFWLACNNLWVFLEFLLLFFGRNNSSWTKILTKICYLPTKQWEESCFRGKSTKVSARLLRSRAMIYGFFASFWFSGVYKSSWTRHITSVTITRTCTDTLCASPTNNIEKNAKIHKIRLAHNHLYSSFSSFWFSGRYEKYVFDAKVQKFRLARSLAPFARSD